MYNKKKHISSSKIFLKGLSWLAGAMKIAAGVLSIFVAALVILFLIWTF